MDYFFRLSQNNQVVYGKISLWDNTYPENYAGMNEEEKQAWKPAKMQILKFAGTKTLKVNSTTLTGYETTLQDAINRIVQFCKDEWNTNLAGGKFETNLEEKNQNFINETLESEIKPSKELKNEFLEMSFI